MDYAQLFQLANLLVLPGWLLLLLVPRWHWTGKLIYSGAYSAAFALLYLFLLLNSWEEVALDFSSLNSVQSLFQHPAALLAGWVHYLAFDLFIAGWMIQNSWHYEIKHYWMIPVLFITLNLGPVGLLLYLLIRLFMGSRTRTNH